VEKKKGEKSNLQLFSSPANKNATSSREKKKTKKHLPNLRFVLQNISELVLIY